MKCSIARGPDVFWMGQMKSLIKAVHDYLALAPGVSGHMLGMPHIPFHRTFFFDATGKVLLTIVDSTMLHK